MREIRDDKKGDEMRHEFIADANEITEGMPCDSALPSAIVRAEGIGGEEVAFALHDKARPGAGEWYGRRVKVTVETIDGKE